MTPKPHRTWRGCQSRETRRRLLERPMVRRPWVWTPTHSRMVNAVLRTAERVLEQVIDLQLRARAA